MSRKKILNFGRARGGGGRGREERGGGGLEVGGLGKTLKNPETATLENFGRARAFS